MNLAHGISSLTLDIKVNKMINLRFNQLAQYNYRRINMLENVLIRKPKSSYTSYT